MKMKKKHVPLILFTLFIMLSLIACNNEPEKMEDDVQVNLMKLYEEELTYAERFTMTHYEGGYTEFTIPGVDIDRSYLIVPEGKTVPINLPENMIVLQQPINNVCFASGSLASLAEAIGTLDCIKTVAIEKDGWAMDAIIKKMDKGEILYSGSFRAPDFEMLLEEDIQLEIDSTMLVSYPEVREKYDELGIPYFIEDSSKEESPLGRMEWVKLLGVILDKEEEAYKWFEEQVEKISVLEEMESTEKNAVLFYEGEKGVYLRNAGDYTAAMLEMAGGENLLADMNPDQGGNEKVTFEDFYSRCKDADYLFWIILSCPYETTEELIESNVLFADFKAVQNGNIYTSKRGFAQRTADLADVILEMNSILNDTSIEETSTFVKLK